MSSSVHYIPGGHVYKGRNLDEVLVQMGCTRADAVDCLKGRTFVFTASDGNAQERIHGTITDVQIHDDHLYLGIDKPHVLGHEIRGICWSPEHPWHACCLARRFVYGVFQLT